MSSSPTVVSHLAISLATPQMPPAKKPCSTPSLPSERVQWTSPLNSLFWQMAATMPKLTRKPCKQSWRLCLLIGSKWIVALMPTTSQTMRSSASREPSTWSVTFRMRLDAVKFASRLTMSTCKCSSRLSTKLKPWRPSAARNKPSQSPTLRYCWPFLPSSPSSPRNWSQNCLRWSKMDSCWSRSLTWTMLSCILSALMRCSILHSWLTITTKTHKHRLRHMIASSSRNRSTRLPCKR